MEDCDESPFEFLSEDEIRCLDALNHHQVEFIVIGGYAVRTHGYLRPVSDLDLVLEMSAANLQGLERALVSMGIRNSQEIIEWFQTRPNPKVPLHFYDVDLLGTVEGLKFGDMLPTAVQVHCGELQLKVISKQQLIQIKEAGLLRGRGSKAEQDREDLEALRKP